MPDGARESVFPGGVRQIGFVIPDLDAAIAQWVALGVAPWLVLRDMDLQGNYRGTDSAPKISIALSNTGDMQVELVQQHCDTPSIYKEFVDKTGGGFNQVAYWIADFDGVRAAAIADGWTEVWCGDADAQARFSYLERPGAPVTIVELTEHNDVTRPMNDMIRAAAASWTPDQPIFIG